MQDRPTTSSGRELLLSGLLLLLASSPALAGGIADLAYPLLAERVAFNRTHFFVFQDADAGFNHGFPSGVFGQVEKVEIDATCLDDPDHPDDCSEDPDRLDRERGTVLRITFADLLPGEFAGVNIEEPRNWGAPPQTGVGFDLTGATELVFDARSPDGVRVEFGAAGSTWPYTTLSSEWQTFRIPLVDLVPPVTDPSDVHILFAVATNSFESPNGGTVLLDDVRYEPVPLRQAADEKALSFPLSTETFGVQTVDEPDPGRVPIPPDQINRNVAATYEAALTLEALADRGEPGDLEDLGWLAEALVYALSHDNRGLPLPPLEMVDPGVELPKCRDGARAMEGCSFHNAVESGDLGLLNEQGPEPEAAKAGDVRLAGFSAGTELCGETGFCLVLDGATGGNDSFAVLALLEAHEETGETEYLEAARSLGEWIATFLTDTTGTGYGGYYLGYPDEGAEPKVLVEGKSIENNADILSAFLALAAVADSEAEAVLWTERANIAGDFVLEMFDPATGCFYAGTVPKGTEPGDGIIPSEEPDQMRGDDVINLFLYLDAQTFTTLPLAIAPRYQRALDWRRPMECMLDRYRKEVQAGGETYRGLNLVEVPVEGPDGIAWEFTAQAVVTLRLVDRLYAEDGFEADAALYEGELAHAQLTAPFGDGRGLVASTMADGDLLPPGEQCLSTPFQCIPERVGLAATTWAVFAERDTNPLDPGLLRLGPLVPGEPTEIMMAGAEPGEAISLVLSLAGPGAGPCPGALGGLCLDVLSPVLLGSATADSAGRASFSLPVPEDAPVGTEVFAQTVIRRGADGVDSVKTAVAVGVVG